MIIIIFTIYLEAMEWKDMNCCFKNVEKNKTIRVRELTRLKIKKIVFF